MSIEWDQNIRTTFNKSVAHAGHTYNTSPLFCDASLAALLDTYPRDRLGIWTFAPHGEGEEAPELRLGPRPEDGRHVRRARLVVGHQVEGGPVVPEMPGDAGERFEVQMIGEGLADVGEQRFENVPKGQNGWPGIHRAGNGRDRTHLAARAGRGLQNGYRRSRVGKPEGRNQPTDTGPYDDHVPAHGRGHLPIR